ncbi:hypothetical protein Hypma_004761 [Hypsizygus marmoreus]|uniref:CCHC-type domain-containing protein n=1 Tax=Hypsizygus marmoreus TaxID=39966 RepID=A0A369IZR6_HYPMA|nr:hypothetical protein Hypma_004761 [Hypsizygus marmoreus]
MSTRYNLRLRPSAVASTGRVSPFGESSLSELLADVSRASALSDSEGVQPVSDVNRARSYSAVVASSIPSNPVLTEAPQGSAPTLGDTIAAWNAQKLRDAERLAEDAQRNAQASQSDDDEGGPWTPVKSRRARNQKRREQPTLSRSQRATVQEAEESLSEAQQDLLRKREQATRNNVRANERPTSRGEGPSKGKNADPRNWGAAGIPADELDLEAQQAAFEAFEAANSIPDYPTPNISIAPTPAATTSLEDELREQIRMLTSQLNKFQELETPSDSRGPAEPVKASTGRKRARGKDDDMRPSKQIASKSYLGKAFEKVGSKHRRGHDGDSEDSSSSGSSDGGSSGSSDESSDSDESDSTSASDSDTSRHRKKASKRRKYSQRTLIRPTPPEKYSGTADTQVFHRFITQSTAYVTDGRVKSKRQVAVICNFLEGKAYTFYTREVSYQPEKWALKKFFKNLFDYCFPVDFRSQQRKKLLRCYQNDRNVKEYVSELTELFTTIGFISKREKVNKLWYGLRPVLQKALWKERLNPETSKWSTVVRAAEINEIADAVEVGGGRGLKKPDHPPTTSNFNNLNPRPSGSNSNGFKHNIKKPDHSTKYDNRDQQKHFQPRPNGQSSFKPFNGGSRNTYIPSGPQQRPQLTDKEKDELRAAGKCFRCKEAGHMSRNCPKGQTVKSNGKQPPGVSSFSLEVQIEEMERLHGLADTTELIHCLDLGMVSLLDEDTGNSSPSDVIRRMDDPLSVRAVSILTWSQPYPGDPDGCILDERFCIYRVSPTEHVIMDSLHDSDTLITSAFLENGAFELANWYAKQMAITHFGGNLPQFSRIPHHKTRDPLAERAEEVLHSGTLFLGDILHDEAMALPRFRVWINPDNNDLYTIYDTFLDFYHGTTSN